MKYSDLSRRAAGRLAIAAMSAAVVVASVVATPAPASAAGGQACLISPALRDVTINQGVGSYANLTRGKDTLVRAYLSLPQTLPSCASNGAFIQVTGGTLTVSGGAPTTVTPTPAPAAPYAQVASYASAPALDAPADLKFVVPGSALANASSAPFPITFSLTVSFQSAASKTGTLTAVTPATFTTKTGSTSPITATVGAPSNNLRVLAVPIGNKSDTSGLQFPSGATTSVQNGMSAVSRVMPIANGIGDLTTPGNGLRYSLLPPSSMIDVGPAGLNLMPAGKLCIEPVNTWPLVSRQLATFLQDWNAANPSSPADRAVGVVWQDVSAGAESSCYEGISDVNGAQAMVRVYSDATSTSDTGALMAHELLHTFGGSHSLNTTADRDAPNRAYNVTSRQFLATNRSLMNTTFDSSYTNNTTLFESGAYALAQCALTPGATGCAAPGAVGVAGAGGPALVLVGSTCGTSSACTTVTSYFDGDFQPRTTPDTTSPYSVVQLSGTTPILATPVAVPCTQEDDAVGGGTPTTIATCSVRVAVTAEAGADRVELRKGSTVLYVATNDGSAPTFTTALRKLATASLVRYTTAAGDDVQPALCADGTLLAWADSSGIRVRRTDQTAAVSPAGALPGAEPSWSPDCTKLVYTTTGSPTGAVEVVGVSTSGTTPSFGTPTRIYSASLLDINGLFTSPAHHPSFLANGVSVVVGINGDIYRIDPGSVTTPTDITCTIGLLQALLANGCTLIIGTSAVEQDPSAGPTDAVAYDRDGNVWQAAADGSGQTQVITNATQPAWAGALTLFARGGTVWARDVDGSETQLTTGTDQWPTVDASARTFAVDRGTTAGTHDIWVGTLTRTGITAQVADNNVARLNLAVFVDCGGGRLVPIQDPVTATSVTSTGGTSGVASYSVGVDPASVCAGGTFVLRASDGWLTATTADGEAGAPHDPTPNIYSLPEGAHLLQFDSWAFSGGGTDPDETAGALSLTWSITGPGGFTATMTGPNPPDAQPPAGGFAPGQYTVTLTIRDSTGRAASTQHHWTVDPDADHDGITAAKDKTCGGVSADNDPSNADADYDGDGSANRDDSQPCTAPNATVSVTPTSINVSNDTGNPVNITISTSALDLTTVDPATVRLTVIGGKSLNPALVAYTWSATASTASAKFDRATVDRFLRENNLIGSSISFTVTGSNSSTAFLGTGTTATCSGNKCPMT